METNEKRYQVFISSTFRDLQEERQKVLQAILEMKAFPAGMELFPAADEEQFEFIKREIDSSDYYILIVAGKYGSLSPTGISYTEMEYDYAVSQGKAIVRLLHVDISLLPATHIELDAMLRSKLDTFRENVKSGRMCKMYLNPDDLKSKVWQSLTSEIALKPGTGWVRADNARRIDDLKEITDLQREVMSLRTQIQTFERAAGESRLPSGNDRYKYVINLDEKIASECEECPSSFDLISTWNELFIACFNKDYPDPSQAAVHEGLRKHVMKKFAKAFQSVEFTKEQQPAAFSNINALVPRCRILFLGKGLMRVESRTEGPVWPSQSSTEENYWVLTQKGLAEVALLVYGREI